MPSNNLHPAVCGSAALLLLCLSGMGQVNAVPQTANRLSQKPQASTIVAHIEFEETTSADISLHEHNGQYTLSATYLEDKQGNFEFGKKTIKNKHITRQQYLTLWNALSAIEFWQMPTTPWPMLDKQAGQVSGTIRVKAVDRARHHAVSEYVVGDGTYLASRATKKQREGLRHIAVMMIDLTK